MTKKNLLQRNRPLIVAAALAISSAGVMAQATQPAPPTSPPDPAQTAPPPPPPVQSTQLSGSVTGYNFGPRGNVESLMLRTGEKLSQVNFPPDVGSAIAAAVHVGDQVTVTARPAMGLPDHGVYDLASITPANGPVISLPGPGDRHEQHVEGTVKSLNYGRHGEVNGVMLDSGDLVHFGPAGANLANIAVNQKVSVDGNAEPMLSGHLVIEAESINGIRIPHPPPPHGRGPAGGPPHPDGAGPGPRDEGDAPAPQPPPPAPDAGNPPPPPAP